ncbi:hypothetical protein DPMN_061684 [Dreissena polymorpha]|uniref:Uncharacterized protein n=1 Tax=Dreissena polymorpha TaxID=45954 RepID=A0A9D4C8E3_DREPO|nr:hypothetical protein DPMN_061684 [Dreissena polymorpha]
MASFICSRASDLAFLRTPCDRRRRNPLYHSRTTKRRLISCPRWLSQEPSSCAFPSMISTQCGRSCYCQNISKKTR